jgi:hypothetical protein
MTHRTIKKRVSTALILTIFMFLSGCKDVFVNCKDISKIQSDLGVLNLPQFQNGVLLRLNMESHRADRLITIALTPNQLTTPTSPIDSTSALTDADFEITASGDVPSTVVADFKTFVNSHTRYEITASSRTDVADPLGALNADANAKARAAQIPPSDIMLFISGIVTGTSLDIKVEGASGVEGDADVVRFGKFKLKVHYNCKNEVKQVASHGAGLLWKGIAVKLDPNTSTFTFDSRAFNLKDFDFSATALH